MSQSGRRLALALMLGTALFVVVISPASSTQREESALADPVLALVKVEPPREAQEPAAEAAEDDAPAVEPLEEPVSPAPRAEPPPPARTSVPAARPSVRTSDAPAPRYRTVRMCVTAYCPCSACCGRNAKGITASGRSVRANGAKFVAADTRLLPFNTKVSIPGYNSGAPVPVLDTGRAIKGNRLDVFFPSHSTAKKWGSRWLTCRVYDR